MAKSRQISLAMIACVQLGSADNAPGCKEPHGKDCVLPHIVDDQNSLSPWTNWKLKFGKVYESAKEEAHRCDVWTTNTMNMMQVNEQNISYSLGWNAYSDMTMDELAQFRGFIRKDTPSMINAFGATYRGNFEHVGNLTDLPSDVDWTMTDIEVVTYVKTQHCGDCWAYSAAGTLESALAVANGWTTSLSPQQFVDCSGAGSCSGGGEDRAMTWAAGNFVCSLDSYPETGQDGSCNWNCDQVITAGSIYGIYSITANEASLCAGLLQRPISVAVAADDTFSAYSGGILNYKHSGKSNHAIVAVGYGYWNGDAYWKVKNSWGESWGLGGYALLFRGKGGQGQNNILKDAVGVYVYGPYNPSMYLTDMQGVRVYPPTSPTLSQVVV